MAVKAGGSLPGGTRLGRYEIVSLLATGGMGEVYVARDATLGRQVALKVLPRELTSDADRTARFVREAEASSALNHPAIVTVHDAGSAGDVQFLAMELIDGEPLSEWMRTHRDRRRGLELMAQVAEGLAAAHANGIVHRDLKPANIVVGRGGYAKVVDFGVAKLTERLNGSSATHGDTAPAAVIGTAAYMSPEQVEGRMVDHRTDVFAFGTVLYELIAGRNPFAAGTDVDTMHNVVHRTPPLEAIPRELQRIVRRCLAKDPERRYQSMKDLALDLREAVAEPDAAPRPRRRAWWGVAAVLAVVLAAALILSRFGPDAPAAQTPRRAETQMTRLTNSGKVLSAAISPDGKYLAHVVQDGDQQALWVKQIATGTMTRIAPPEPNYYFHVRVSPDGDYIYYLSATRAEPNVAHLYQIPLLGGTVRRIAADIEFTFAISPDGKKVAFRRFNAFDREHRLTVAGVDGGEEIVLRRKFPQFMNDPAWTPDGKAITFIGGAVGKSVTVSEIALDTRQVTELPVPKWPGLRSIMWLNDNSGMLVSVYDRESPPQIWLLGRDGATRKITSDINAYFSVTATADSTAIAAVRDETDSNIWTLDVTASARPGTSALQQVTTGLGNFYGGNGVRWLNDREVLYTAMDGQMPTFFAVSATGGTPRRMIHGMNAWNPVISRDGKRMAFSSDKSGDGKSEIWISDLSGSNPRQVTTVDRANSPSFAGDGKSLVYTTSGENQLAFRVPLDGGVSQQLTDVPTSRALASPDSKWLLCRLRSREPNVPLWRTALVPLDGKGPIRYFNVPAYGGTLALQWHPDGKAFSFLDAKDGVTNVWLQDVDGGAPRQATFFDSGEIFSFDWSRDGRKLVLSRGEPTSDAVLIRNFR